MKLVRYTTPATRFSSPFAAFSRSPWTGLEDEINRLFENTLGEFATARAPDQMALDLYEDEANTYVRAELPGVTREAIQVEVVDGYLNLSASRKFKRGESEETTNFSRSVKLPDTVKTDAITAAYENGILTITLPKQEESKPRRISVSVK